MKMCILMRVHLLLPKVRELYTLETLPFGSGTGDYVDFEYVNFGLCAPMKNRVLNLNTRNTYSRGYFRTKHIHLVSVQRESDCIRVPRRMQQQKGMSVSPSLSLSLVEMSS